MKDVDWRQLEAARQLLGLGERASLAEIRQAYRSRSKACHPDLAPPDQAAAAHERMQALTAAYDTLRRYCADYRFRLVPAAGETMSDEDWWLDRFGQDPVWGRPGGDPP
ncbi:MAG: J domain-containing protein [Thermodesulfobacteriota bacterium]